jgi:hypothetical protein
MLPVAASRGKPTQLSIALVSGTNRRLTALQWELFFPASQIHIEDSDWAAAKGAVASGKSLSCVRQLRRQPEGFAYRCILAGGANAIPNGPIAVVKIVVVDASGSASPVLRLENIFAASAAAVRIAIRPVEATITVR